MKTLSAVVVGLLVALSAQVAGAYVVQVVTAVPVEKAASAEDTSQLDEVVRSAIRDVLDHAIAFTPTVVRIEDARIVGAQLYLVLLVADAEGEATIEALLPHQTPDARQEAPDAEGSAGIIHPGELRL
jgi:hypothetical protein